MPANQITRQQRQLLATFLQDRYLIDENADTVANFMDGLNNAGFTLISDRRRMPLFQELSTDEINRISEAVINSLGVAVEPARVRSLCMRLEDVGLAIVKLVRTPKPMQEAAIGIQPLIDRLIVKGDTMRFNGFEYSPEGIRVSYARFKGKDALYFKSIALFEKWLNGLSKVEQQPGKPPEVKPDPLPPSRPDTRPVRHPEELYPDTIAEALLRYTSTRSIPERLTALLTPTESTLVARPSTRMLTDAQRYDAIRHLKNLSLRTTPANILDLETIDYDRWLKQHAERRGWQPLMANAVDIPCPVAPEVRARLIVFLDGVGNLVLLPRRQWLSQRQIDTCLVARASQYGWSPDWRPVHEQPAPTPPTSCEPYEDALRALLDLEYNAAVRLWRNAGRLGGAPVPQGFDDWTHYFNSRVYQATRNPANAANWLYYAPELRDGRIVIAWNGGQQPAEPVPQPRESFSERVARRQRERDEAYALNQIFNASTTGWSSVNEITPATLPDEPVA